MIYQIKLSLIDLKELKDLVKPAIYKLFRKNDRETEKVLVEGISLKRNNEVFGKNR